MTDSMNAAIIIPIPTIFESTKESGPRKRQRRKMALIQIRIEVHQG
jgi:hypothetical protein